MSTITPSDTKRIPPQDVKPGMITTDGVVLSVSVQKKRNGSILGYSIEHRSTVYMQYPDEPVVILGEVSDEILASILEELGLVKSEE